MRVLCVTRAYPPVVGGMEKLSAEFTQALAAHADVQLIANRWGKRALPFFLPRAALRLRSQAQTVDVVHLGDALMTVLLPFIPRAGKRPVVAVTLHGLDIRYPNAFYRALLRRFLPRVDLALCISRFVEQEFRQRFPGVASMVVNPCIAEPIEPASANREELRSLLRRSVSDGPLLLSVGRLVPRKGLAWFVERVLPLIPAAQLLVIGDGPESSRIVSAAERAGVAARVIFAGSQSRAVLTAAYRTADIFVMPNIPVAGDAEGFGLVALEAASAGLPVLAADLEGIPDAVIEDQTGVLIPALDVAAWTHTIQELLGSPRLRILRERAPHVVRARFSWDARIREVLAAFARLLDP